MPIKISGPIDALNDDTYVGGSMNFYLFDKGVSMKPLISLIVFTVLFSQVSQAFEIVLPCKDIDSGATLPISAIKEPFKAESGKWDARYFVLVKEQKLQLLPRGSGDEDYSEYDIENNHLNVGIASAAIQWKFEWVSLNNEGGSVFADCRLAK